MPQQIYSWKPSTLQCLLALLMVLFSPVLCLSQITSNRESTHPTAQTGSEDFFDQFFDYNEFDEGFDEKPQTSFFQNGRFFTLGLMLGSKGFTDDLSKAYTPNGNYGLYMVYFFDLRFATQLSFTTGNFAFAFPDQYGYKAAGNVTLNLVSLDSKYYFDTQNVNRGLADLNPYLLLGISNFLKTMKLIGNQTGIVNNTTETSWGLNLGTGIEIPVVKNKAYFGLQGALHYVTFSDSNSFYYIYDRQKNSTLTQTGMHYEFMGLIGVNF